MSIIKRITELLMKYFTVWILAFSIVAYFFPERFIFFSKYIKFLLGFIMLCMGLTLEVKDFKRVIVRPIPVLVGVLCQFIIMPFLGFSLAVVAKLSTQLALGFVLLGSCPGGVASNVLVYLARGNVALSVLMTSVSTIISPIMIPVLLLVYANKCVEIDFVSLFLSTFQIVLLPVIIGLLINQFTPKVSKNVKDYTPAISTIALIVIITSMIAINKDNLESKGVMIFVLVVIHNFLGLFLGYLIPKILNYPKSYRKTIALEVGVQNAGLGSTLALLHFSPLSAVPSVFFAVWGLIVGSAISSYWGKRDSTLVKEFY